MSISYTDQTLLGYGTCAGTDDTIYGRMGSKNHAYLVHSLVVTVDVAGTETDTIVVLETDAATPVILAQVATGTAAAKTHFETIVTDALHEVDADTGLQIRLDSTGNDASHSVYWQVFGSFPDR